MSTHVYRLAEDRGVWVIRVTDGKRTWNLDGRACYSLDQLGAWLDELEAEQGLPKGVVDDLNCDLVLLRSEGP